MLVPVSVTTYTPLYLASRPLSLILVPIGRTAGSAATVPSAGLVPDAVIPLVQYAVAVNDDAVAGRAFGTGVVRARFAHPSATIQVTAITSQQNTNPKCCRDCPLTPPRLPCSSCRNQAQRWDEQRYAPISTATGELPRAV